MSSTPIQTQITNNIGKAAIVTGGGTGIGKAISLKLATEGINVAIIYSRSRAESQDTALQVCELGQDAVAIEADVADRDDVGAALEKVMNRWGRLDYLVNNAGTTVQLPFHDLNPITDEIWDRLLGVNLKGTFNCCQAAAPHLRQQRGSAIVNVGSIAGETGYGSSLPYAVSKSAVHGLTKSLARALAPDIRVNCIAPGAVDTRWWLGYEDKMRKLAGDLAMQRISTAEDIAETVYMLLTSVSVTGQILKADNGQTL